MSEPFDKFKFWVLGAKDAAQKAVARSLSVFHVVTKVKQPGYRQGNMRGVPAGKVAWPVDPATHDGVSFAAADVFFAHYDADKREVYMLDDIDGTRHPGALPLKVGKNVEILDGIKRSGKGVVYRTAEYGTDGLDKNIFQHVNGDIIAHHRAPKPPRNSTQVHDPGEGNDDWQGGLHYPLRVRRWLAKFCSGGGHSTTGPDGEELFAPLFNMGTNGDNTPAHGAAHWDHAEGTLSKSGGGPLVPADDNNHLLGETKDAKVHQGANDIDTLYGPIAKLYGPEEHIDVQWEPGGKGPYIVRVEKRPDFLDKHKNHCGKEVPLVIKWQSWKDTNSYQPKDPTPASEKSDPTPAAEKGDPGPKTGDPPTLQKDPTPNAPKGSDPSADKPQPAPAMQKVIAPLPRPGTTSPGQVETPSIQGHAEPALPDGPQTGRSSPSTYEQAWLNRFGFTEKEFITQPVVADLVAVPTYKSATPNNNATGAARWEPALSQETIYTADADGRVTSRDQTATGSGDFCAMPASVDPKHVFVENKASIEAGADVTGLFVLSVNNGTNGIEGWGGIGSRLITGGLASGWKYALDFTSTTEPNIVWSGRDATGAISSAATFNITSNLGVSGNITCDTLNANIVTATEGNFDSVVASQRFELPNGFYIGVGADGGLAVFNDSDVQLAEFGDELGGTTSKFVKAEADEGFDPPWIALDLVDKIPDMPAVRSVKTYKRDGKKLVRTRKHGPAVVESVTQKPLGGLFIRRDGKVCAKVGDLVFVLAVESVTEAK